MPKSKYTKKQIPNNNPSLPNIDFYEVYDLDDNLIGRVYGNNELGYFIVGLISSPYKQLSAACRRTTFPDMSCMVKYHTFESYNGFFDNNYLNEYLSS